MQMLASFQVVERTFFKTGAAPGTNQGKRSYLNQTVIQMLTTGQLADYSV